MDSDPGKVVAVVVAWGGRGSKGFLRVLVEEGRQVLLNNHKAQVEFKD